MSILRSERFAVCRTYPDNKNMGVLTWLTRNWADTDKGEDSRLRPLDLPLSLAEALAKVENAVRGLPLWEIVAVDVANATIRALRRTRLFRFVDDITVRCEPVAEKQTRVHARSQARLGKGDFGQNRRNLLQLWAVLRDATAQGSPA